MINKKQECENCKKERLLKKIHIELEGADYFWCGSCIRNYKKDGQVIQEILLKLSK